MMWIKALPWGVAALMAFAARGDGDQAERLFALLNPVNHAATRAGAGAVLAGLLLQLALGVQRAVGGLERQVGAFAARELAGGADITCHF